MKVFISYSRKDRWAARRICEDLEKLGCTTFLDEKSIQSGESIDLSIRTHLRESDHFLLLLSPASAKSDWVLMELGGAIALGRIVVPILLYVGANEVPQAISLKLARDINEIEVYYSEIGKRLGSRADVKNCKTKEAIASNESSPSKQFRKGARVRIPVAPPANYLSETKSVAWVTEMRQYLGREARITETIAPGIVKLDIDNGLFFWATAWLTRQ